MEYAAKHGAALVDNLLDASVIEAGQLVVDKSKQDLGVFIKTVFDGQQIFARVHKRVLRLEIEEGLPEVEFDPNRIGQVLGNLISNAIKFSGPNTAVEIVVKRSGEFIETAVNDRGPGVSKEVAAKLFSEFKRGTARSQTGQKSTGLGLAIAKKMIDAHGGRIWVESEVGQGSSFRFTIPLASSNDLIK
jgi:signal transduction histidine kinase